MITCLHIYCVKSQLKSHPSLLYTFCLKPYFIKIPCVASAPISEITSYSFNHTYFKQKIIYKDIAYYSRITYVYIASYCIQKRQETTYILDSNIQKI